jgi:hypothetical protein
MKSTAELIQHISPVALALVVIERVERWIGNAGFLLEPITRPSLLNEQFLKLANDHGHRLCLQILAVNTPYLK